MSPFTFFFSASVFLSGFVCVLIGTIIIFRSRNPVNLLYFAMAVGLFWAGLSETFLRVAPDQQSAAFWFSSSRVGWLTVYPLFLHFASILSDHRVKYVPL